VGTHHHSELDHLPAVRHPDARGAATQRPVGASRDR
jgi:hypothetical protein